MKKLFVLMSAVALVAGCSTSNDVAMNADYQNAVAASEKARMEAIGRIALQGEMGAVAAAMMLSQDRGNDHRAPVGTGDRAVSLANAIVPALGSTLVGVGQIAATVYATEVQADVALGQSDNNKAVAINNSDNDTAIAIHTNDTMADIAEVTIVDPKVVTPTNNVVCVTDVTYTCE